MYTHIVLTAKFFEVNLG